MKKNFLFASSLFLLSGIFLFSCKKKSKPETLTFDYTYPDISFTVSDSASFGSTTAGWTYVVVQKIDNRPFLKLLSDKKILAEDVSSAKLKSCTIQLLSPSDSSFNVFDSSFVKVGGYFIYQGTPYFSAYPDVLVGQLFPITKTGSKTLTMNPIDIGIRDQIGVDNDVAFRLKLVSPNVIVLPSYSMKAQLIFTITGTTH